MSFLLIVFLVTTQTWATCGGGGGGGTGGMGGGAGSGGGTTPTTTYAVPWKLIQPPATPKEGLAVYWFPANTTEVTKSSLLNSRTLSNYATQCVTMGIVDFHNDIGKKFASDGKVPVVVLANADGTVVGSLRPEQVPQDEPLAGCDGATSTPALAAHALSGAMRRGRAGGVQVLFCSRWT